jgi:hypothetical protein
VLWKALYVQRIIFFFGKINYLFRTGFFIHHRIVSEVKIVENVSDRMSRIVMIGGRCGFALNAHAPTANRNDDSKDTFL